jgi:hypothetical protein
VTRLPIFEPSRTSSLNSPDLENRATDAKRSRRPWIEPGFQALDLTTARASGCASAQDGGSC